MNISWAINGSGLPYSEDVQEDAAHIVTVCMIVSMVMCIVVVVGIVVVYIIVVALLGVVLLEQRSAAKANEKSADLPRVRELNEYMSVRRDRSGHELSDRGNRDWNQVGHGSAIERS